MIDVLVFVHKDASLARYDQVARELEAAGLKVKARHATVGVITGTVEDRSMLSAFQKIADVTGVQDQSNPSRPAAPAEPEEG